MCKKKTIRIFMAALLLAALTACAPSEMYTIGQDMVKQNRWEEAAGYFEQALKEDPENADYKTALQQAREQAARARYLKVKKAFDGNPDANVPTLEQFGRDIAQARKQDPSNQELKDFDKRLQEKIKSQQEQVKTLYTQADGDMLKEDWTAAVAKLRQVNRLYPNYEDAANRLSRAEQEGARIFYQQGMGFSRQDEWQLAAQAFKSAMDINPGYMDVARRYEEAKSKDNHAYYDAEAEKAIGRQNWQRAITLLEKAADYQPDNQGRARKLAELKAKVAKIYFDDATRLTNQGLLAMAVKKLDLVKTYQPSFQNDIQFKALSKNLQTKLMERAHAHIEREQWGNALIWLQKLETLNPNYPDLFQKMVETRDRINRRIRKSIAVFDFGSPSNNKDAGKIVADKLITFLHKHASGDLRIIERENLQSILREMQLSQTGIVDIKSAQTVGKMRGIDTFIMGNVLHYSAQTTDNPSTSQVKVLVDEEDVANPEYQTWLIMHPRPTEEEMKTAPPRTVKKRNYQFVSYRQGVARVSSLLEISYKLVDTVSGENIFTNTVSGKSVKEDSYSDSVAMANIKRDPLELPTETEVLDELTNQKVGEMGQSVLKNYQSLEVVYFKEGQTLQKRRNYEQAIEKYIDAIYDEKLKGISTPVTNNAQESIEKLIQDK